MASIIFQIARNKVLFGNDLEVDAHLLGSEDRIQIQGPNGPVLRFLGFGERNRLVRMAAQSSSVPVELAAVIKEAALDEPGTAQVPPLVLEALALHFSGAGSGAPGFSTQAGILAHQFGWSPRELESQNALEADALAAKWMEAHDAAQPDDGWHRIVLQPGAAAKDESSLEDIVRELAQDLLDRYHAMLNREVFELARNNSTGRAFAGMRRSQKDPARPPHAPGRSFDFPERGSNSPQPAAPDSAAGFDSRGNTVAAADTPVSQSSGQNPASPATPVLSTSDASPGNPSSSTGFGSKDETVSAEAAADLKSDPFETAAAQKKQSAQAGGLDQHNPEDDAQNSLDLPLPAAAEAFDWDVLGLSDTSLSSLNDPGYSPTAPASPWRDNSPSQRDPFFQPLAAAETASPVRRFLDTPFGIQQSRRQSAGFELESFQEPALKGNSGKPGLPPEQDVIQTIADALHRTADLRGIDP